MTENQQPVFLSNRTLITIDGTDAAHFLQTIITTDIDAIKTGGMYAGALLSPQGKVLFDFLIGRDEKRFLLDIAQELADGFIRRLSLYKLRSDVKIEQTNHNIISVFTEENSQNSGKILEKDDNTLIFQDKRFKKPANVLRIYQFNKHPQPFVNHKQKWDDLRIENGIAESGSDFAPADVFPHDINYDQISGLSFTKGCYIGQEVISRMQHRGTARRRVVVATGALPLPEAGTEITAAGKVLGTLGTVAGNHAIALVRIDRVANALQAGEIISANGVALTLAIPQNAHFTFSAG
ncbi:MAG: Folate-binding protein YgfZ [Candidatus Tokpelaia hoelldobleri]|uniref:Folate-binding protein YgfZ n=1 Tax=Candidatus Tokpelaia hoelldobleri TaxID=1902579 RepID=A0A1U9JVQ0_9HYPH|nr:MAG: Folate-binding protein YgfZ [Candidatus Tokpelaia hoelldoblerii]